MFFPTISLCLHFLTMEVTLAGCWIMFKVPDSQMTELVAYELMSANDAPERDPMNWCASFCIVLCWRVDSIVVVI